MTRRLAVVLALLLCQATAWAHKASDSYLMVDVKGQAVTAQWDIALRDIDFALGLDRDGNAEITWGELRARQSDVAAWALSRLTVSRGGVCPLGVTGLQVDDHTDGGYAVLHLRGECPGATGALGLEYRLLFDLDKLHRGLLRLTLDGRDLHHGAFAYQRCGAVRCRSGITLDAVQPIPYRRHLAYLDWL